MEISFRRAGVADIRQMCALLSELFSLESDFSPDSHKQAAGLKFLLNDASGSAAVFVAERGGEIAGMCSVQVLISTAEGGPVGLVEDVIVRREDRGKGIGGRLLAEIEGWCLSKKITRLQLLRDVDNTNAHIFYLKQGWSDTNLLCMRIHL